MRIFIPLAISLLALTAPVRAVTVYWPATGEKVVMPEPNPHLLKIRIPVKALDVPVSQFDDRFGNMVAEVPCSVPYTFVTGTIAQASQVNANFTAVANCLNSIYASDIMPTSLAQATFGGTLPYSFPAGINVAGGPSNPVESSSGALYLEQNGANNSAYGIFFGMQNCGGTGSYNFQVAGTSIDTIDCTHGNITNTYGSELANAVIAGNGNFTASSGPVQLCPGGSCSASSEFTVTTGGVATAAGPIEGGLANGPSPIPSASPGAPAGLCYRSSGTPCTSTFHEVWDTSVSNSISGCANVTLCSTATAVNFPFAFNNAFYACFGDGQPAGAWPMFINTNTLQASYYIFNLTGSTLSGTVNVYWDCRGI